MPRVDQTLVWKGCHMSRDCHFSLVAFFFRVLISAILQSPYFFVYKLDSISLPQSWIFKNCRTGKAVLTVKSLLYFFPVSSQNSEMMGASIWALNAYWSPWKSFFSLVFTPSNTVSKLIHLCCQNNNCFENKLKGICMSHFLIPYGIPPSTK